MSVDPAAEATGPERLQSRSGSPLTGRIEVPGDKSISHRALILGGLASGTTRIEGLLEGDDVLRTAVAVRALGASVERLGAGKWSVQGGRWRSPAEPIDCGNSGTGARLLMGAVAGLPIEATFTGDKSLRRRPMKRVLDPLRAMGAQVDGEDLLPITISGGPLGEIFYRNDRASAQVKSAILLAGLGSRGAVEVLEPRPSRDHSEHMLRAFGGEVESLAEGAMRRIRLGARRSLVGTEVSVPGDPSSAAFPIVAAVITPGSDITTAGVLINPLRIGFLTTLIDMGASITVSDRRTVGGEEVADIRARYSHLHGVEVPAERAPSMIDEYPILAIAAAFASGPSVMHGLAELRVKESDRLSKIREGLEACGVVAHVAGDNLHVEGCEGAVTGGAAIATEGDHRLAMSFLVMGLATRRPVVVDRASMIATSFPDFARLICTLGGSIETVD
nr:3-phosphoshikimate 1-carboxyvinyltransferase [uncultured Sphingosinicella sp.]